MHIFWALIISKLMMFSPIQMEFFPVTEEIVEEDRVDSHCLTKEEKKIADMVNKHRRTKGLPAVKISKSLSYVARKHTAQMNHHFKELTHSWKGCNYDRDYNCMWKQPKQLTGYPGHGFEIAYGYWRSDGKARATAEDAMKMWIKSKGHHDVMVNRSHWKRNKWNAMGVGISGGYAAVWFGMETDTKGTPAVCR